MSESTVKTQKKYFYYCWKDTQSSTEGSFVGLFDNEFDLGKVCRDLLAIENSPCIVTYWQEISRTQFESFADFVEDATKSEPKKKLLNLVPDGTPPDKLN